MFSHSDTMDKKSFLQRLSESNINSFNYVIEKGARDCCMDIDPVLTDTSPSVKISICDAEVKALSAPMSLRKHKKIIFPSEARMRKCTYYAELHLHLLFESNDESVQTKRIFFIPLMLKSDLCLLSGMNKEELIEVLEDKYDPGGYFIVNGTERIIRQFLVARSNFPIALIDSKFKKRCAGFTEYAVLIRSVKDYHTSRNVYLHYMDGGFVRIGLQVRNKMYYIPFMLVMKALKDDTDLSIVEEIMKFRNGDSHLREILINMLRDLYNFDQKKGKLKKDAKSYLGQSFSPVIKDPYTPCEISDYLFRKCLLIHLTDNEDKHLFLSYSICKLFSLVSNEFKPEDLDNPVFQEVLTGGQIYLMSIKDGAEFYLKSVENSLTRSIKMKKDYNLIGYARKCTNSALSLTPRIKNILSTGNFPGRNNGLSSNSGFTVVLKRNNVFATAAQFTSVNKFSLNFYGKNMRKYYPESWGFLCPVQTPEGENSGLHNYLSSACHILDLKTPRIESKVIFKFGAIFLDDPLTLTDIPKCFIYIDGKIFGWIRHRKIDHFLAQLKYLRLENFIPSSTEIILVEKTEPQIVYPGIYIFSNPCRLSREVLHKRRKVRLGIFEQLFCNECEEVKDSNILSVAAGTIPFIENNPAVRSTFTCVKSRQAISFPFTNAKYRTDVKYMELTSPQKPLVKTTIYDQYNLDKYPLGTNAVIAIMSYSGYDMEDSILINKSSVERGLMRDMVQKTVIFDFQDLADELKCNITEISFQANSNDPYISLNLDSQGLPYVGANIFPDQPLLSVYCKKSGTYIIKLFQEKKKAVIQSIRFMGTQTATANNPLPDETRKIAITYGFKRIPEVGDKFSNRHGQKGVCGYIMPAEDLPFSTSGIVPDVLFNPHGLPSRMSIGMMLEIIASKSAMVNGRRQKVEPFEFTTETALDTFGNYLAKAGFDFYGTEKFYSGTSGNELEADIYCGSVYYFRLHHVVEEKYQVKSVNEIDPATRQPVNMHSGALRFGEMERDAILAHGAIELTMDRLFHSSDECVATVCPNCRVLLQPLLMNYSIEEKNEAEELINLVEDLDRCPLCDNTAFCGIKIPHVFVYLLSELSALGINVKFSVSDINPEFL
nr:DNA-directed RNA polymerase I subunit RPA2 isoform X2 [Parasteatoda tepidariorum]